MANDPKIKQTDNDVGLKKRRFKKKRLIITVFSLLSAALLFGFLINYFLNLQTLIANKNSIIQQQAESEKRKYDEIQALKKEKKALEEKSQNETKEEDTETETEKVKPEIDKTRVSIEVLNGSGVLKAATNFSNILKEVGYTNVVKITDADNYEYENITIEYPKSKKLEAESIDKDLREKKYDVTLTESTDLNVNNIQIIVGKLL